VCICAPASECRVRAVGAIESTLSRGGAAVVRADADAWTQTLVRATNVCRRKLPPPAPRKVCVISDVDVYVACDRGCLSDLKKLLTAFAESPVSIVFACDGPIGSKVASAQRCGVHVERVDDLRPPPQECLGVARRCLESSLPALGGLDVVYDMTDAWGGNMFTDTLFHNAPRARASEPASLAVHLERAVPYATFCAGASIVSLTDSHVRKTVNGYRAGLACGWWADARGVRGSAAATSMQYTNALSQCNLRATTKKRLTATALDVRCSLAEVTWGEGSR
jgi:hypothetical protein